MSKAYIFDLSDVPTSEAGYPLWEWPSKTDQLLFDIGYSYAITRQAESMLRALYTALGAHETAQPESEAVGANSALREELGRLLAKMEDFREHRLADVDEIYKAGYLAGAKLDRPGDSGKD